MQITKILPLPTNTEKLTQTNPQCQYNNSLIWEGRVRYWRPAEKAIGHDYDCRPFEAEGTLKPDIAFDSTSFHFWPARSGRQWIFATIDVKVIWLVLLVLDGPAKSSDDMISKCHTNLINKQIKFLTL